MWLSGSTVKCMISVARMLAGQTLALRRPYRGLLVQVALGAELLEVHERDAVDELAVAPLAGHHLDGHRLAVADHGLIDRHGVIETQHAHHLGVDVPKEDDLVLGVAQDFDVAVAGALQIAAQQLADGRERHARPRLGEELGQLIDIRVVARVLGVFVFALEIVAGAVDIGHHGLDAGAEGVVLQAQAIELAQREWRLDDALVARRADVELLVFVLRLERIRLDGIAWIVDAVRTEVLTKRSSRGELVDLRRRLYRFVGHAASNQKPRRQACELQLIASLRRRASASSSLRGSDRLPHRR